MPLVSGATAAGFSIVRLLGRGEIGELYLAENPRLPRRHALKILWADVSADPDYCERFNRESDRAAALWHPHIVGLYDRGKFEGRLWLSMDYVDGADTAKLLTDTYPDGMPPGAVVEIVSAIADALDCAHDHGLLHRYVNPSNILLTESTSDRRRIMLAGFGVARRHGDINSLTRANMMVGTASYSAPEQLVDDSIDARADQYALACTAFHLLTGSPPFAHIKLDVLISKQLNQPPPRPGDVRPELAHFDAVFARALAKAPSDRFRRCQDFAEALAADGSKKPSVPVAGATDVLTVPQTDGAPPTEPAVPAPPHSDADDAIAMPDILPGTEIDDAILFQEPAVSGAEADGTSTTSHRRRLLHTAALLLTIMTVALGAFWIVMALRSASESQDTPTNVETSSAITTTSPASPAPATVTAPPISTAPAVATTTPPTRTPSSAATTTPPTSATSLPQTTMPPTTTPLSPPRTTPAAGVDLRPAIGIPCGPEQTGMTTISNSGVPVSCVGTPGGFAWEPPGGD